MVIKYVLGLDQTGAVRPDGRPRPLPAALLDLRILKKKTLHSGLRLNSLTRSSVQELLQSCGLEGDPGPGLILIDCNLGVPQDCGLDVRGLLKKARRENRLGQPFGAAAAHAFFTGLRPSGHSLWNREVELLTGAQSIFKRYPFQRNVSCGSYRILRELAEDLNWFDVWPSSRKRPGRAILAEGYPSLYWKEIFHSQARKKERLQSALRSSRYFLSGKKLSELSADEADALVLCVAGDLHKSLLSRSSGKTKREGWILGV